MCFVFHPFYLSGLTPLGQRSSVDHVATKTRKRRDSFTGLVKSFSYAANDDGETSAEPQTHDEKINAWIRRVGAAVLHRISFELQRVSIVISGAGSERVREARKRCSPGEANLVLASLPRWQRALTVVAADAVSLSFGPDERCDAIFIFKGLHLKVGNPMHADRLMEGQRSSADVPYAWHTLAHPFDLALVVKGVIPFLVWSLNYDHRWQTRSLGASLATPEVAVNLSPDHLHTVLLHLDDYTDAASSYNEWFVWLKNVHGRLKETSSQEKSTYRNNYERIKGGKSEEASKPTSEEQLTLAQMKDMEKRMTSFEIMSLRCFAMRTAWRIPKGNEELEDFLRGARSLICDYGEEDSATPADAPSPFQRRYPTSLHALVGMLRENSILLAPHVTVESSAETLHIDFPGARETHSVPSIPSSVAVTGVSFDIDQMNVLHLDADESSESENPRPFLDLSLQILGCKWEVVDDAAAALKKELPLFRDRSPLGILYMVS